MPVRASAPALVVVAGEAPGLELRRAGEGQCRGAVVVAAEVARLDEAEVVPLDEMVRPDVRPEVARLEVRHRAEPEAEVVAMKLQERAGMGEVARPEVSLVAEVTRLEVPRLAEMEPLARAPDLRRADVG